MKGAGKWPETWDFASGSVASYLYEPHRVTPFSVSLRDKSECCGWFQDSAMPLLASQFSQ